MHCCVSFLQASSAVPFLPVQFSEFRENVGNPREFLLFDLRLAKGQDRQQNERPRVSRDPRCMAAFPVNTLRFRRNLPHRSQLNIQMPSASPRRQRRFIDSRTPSKDFTRPSRASVRPCSASRSISRTPSPCAQVVKYDLGLSVHFEQSLFRARPRPAHSWRAWLGGFPASAQMG